MSVFRRRFPYVPQVDQADCGVAALSMVLRFYGSQVPLARLRVMAGTDLEGTTALGLVKAAQSLGFETQAIRADMGLFDEPGLPFPFIVSVITDEGYAHYYVVEGVSRRARKERAHRRRGRAGREAGSILVADPDPRGKVKALPHEVFARRWTGVALFMAPAPEYKPSKEKPSSLLAFLPLLVRQGRLIVNIVTAALLVTIINIVGAYYLQSIVDDYIPHALGSTLALISISLIAAYLIQQVLSFAQAFLLNVLGQRLVIDIILSYLRHVFQLPMSFFATRRTGEITSRFSDANAIITALASSVMSLFLDLSVILVTGAVLCFQNVWLFLLVLVSVPVYAVVVLAFVRAFERQNYEAMQANAVVSSSIIEDLNGIETVKALASEEDLYRRVDSEFTDFLRKSFRLQKNSALQSVLETGVQLVLTVMILWVGAGMVMRGAMSLGQLIAFNALLGYFTSPVASVVSLQTKLQQARVANNRLNEVFLVEGEFGQEDMTADGAADTARLVTGRVPNGDIEFTDVSYRYGFGRDTLSHISLGIHQGEKLAVVGMSGSGKTTLFKLLVNFYQPTSGTVSLGGVSTTRLDKHALRRAVNYLPQEPFIFTGTVRENLSLGAEDAGDEGPSLERLEQAADLACVREDIEGLELGWDTPLSSEATSLSAGQKQRLALARALLSPARVLVLDEATSNQDALTEKKILDNLLALDRTVIFIAHRLSVASKCGRIVVIDRGQVVEDGSHERLLAQGGYYAQLCQA